MLAKIRSAFRSLCFPFWSIPIALLILTFVSYGLRAFALSFYWDDWPNLWFFHRFGWEGIVRAFEGDRPFLAFIYNLSLTVLGDSGQAWQMYALVTRWLCSLGFWWAFAQTWPRHKDRAAWAAALFAVYPGFTQQWIAMVYGQAFILFAALFFSIGLMLWLFNHRGRLARGWMILGTLVALALAAFNMFSTEYFFGLELLRPLLLWLALTTALPNLGTISDNQAIAQKATHPRLPLSRRLWQVAAWWAPYLALVILFVVWRGLIHTFPGHPLVFFSNLRQSPLSALADLVMAMLQDFIDSGLVAWGQPLQALSGYIDQFGSRGALLLLGVILLIGLLAFVYLLRLRADPAASSDPETTLPVARRWWPAQWSVQAILVGLFALLICGWPIWLTGLDMHMGFPQDRYSLAFAVGISLLLAGLIDLLGKNLPRKLLVLSLALGLAAGFHFNTALRYKSETEQVRDFLWQLTWRAPALQPGAILISDSLPFQYTEDDSLVGPLNWTYDPDGKSSEIKYYLADMLVRLRSLPPMQPGLPLVRDFRGITFNGSTSQVVLFSYQPPGCVHVLDPRYDAQIFRLTDRTLRALSVSNPQAMIQPSDTPAKPPSVIGQEPKHQWCYYYEQAELARQTSSWQQIVDLSSDSIKMGYRPEDPSEYLPFIEGYAQMALWDDALEMSKSTLYDAPAVRPAMCAIWQRTFQKFPDMPGKYKPQVNGLLACNIP